MAGNFGAVPIRTSDQGFATDWVNALRLAGIALEGAAAIAATEFTIANNTGPSNVTGLSFAGASVRSFVVEYQIYRNTTGGGATELAESGTLTGVYKSTAATWELTQSSVGDAGVALTITNAGQVQYTSSNITGTAGTSKMTFRARTMPV